MSLLGIDVGTSGCKAAVFSLEGELLAGAYEEYAFQAPQPGQAVLDSRRVWGKVRAAIRRAAAGAAGAVPSSKLRATQSVAGSHAARGDPVTALCAASMGEAMVPVSRDRRILGPSILNFDVRGAEYLPALRAGLGAERLFELNGNTLGNHYGLTKLMWLRDHQPRLYARADLFLNWAGFVAFLLGGEPAVDFSLANRSLLFDLERRDWSEELLRWSGLDRGKLPPAVPSARALGRIDPALAAELGLPTGAVVVSGAHDQCANAVGCGVVGEGSAMLGLGTYLCIVPVYRERPDPRLLIERGLNTEHHVPADRFVSFIYNMSGSIVRWFRETFAAEEHRLCRRRGEDVYERLFAELPAAPSRVMVLPHFFSPMGPPDYISGSSGVLAGLTLATTRGEVLKGILQGAVFSLKECTDLLPGAGIRIADYRVVGGGAKSEAWIQLCADILEKPLVRPRVSEAGALGAAIMAGVGAGTFGSMEEGVRAMVRLDRRFDPDPWAAEAYRHLYGRYRRLWPLLQDWLAG